MNRRLLLTLTLLVVALLAVGCGQAGLRGTVTLNGQEPGAIEVEVAVLNTDHKQVVGKNGAFNFELPPGTYTVEAKAAGVPAQTASVRVEDGSQVRLDLDLTYLPETPITLDLTNPLHQALIEKPWPLLDYRIQADPFGNASVFFPNGDATQAPPEGYQLMRFALLGYPEMDEFELSVEQVGIGAERNDPRTNGGNRSLAMVFGYEDVNNWWVAYLTYTDSTRVARMVNGEQQYICRPRVEDQWWPNNEEYQKAEIKLTRDGDEMVLSVLANGETTSIDGCRFPAADYTPGKLGFGGHSTSDVQSWFIKDITVKEL